ncbi:MAG: restriction endonuclease subunit S [Bacteroidetes bacterium]|nr:restriction endonuclease subunit S [Bacteroidota bacterium]
MDKIFLLKLLNHSTNYLRRIAPDGTQPNLNTGIMKKFEIILPPVELQIHFANIVSKTETLREQYKSSLVELENLYGSLSQRAFKGELEMKVQTL